MPELTCKDCAHWHKMPRAKNQKGGVDLSGPSIGECREQLRMMMVVTEQGPMPQPFYLPTLETMPVCGQHKVREKFKEGCQ